MKKIGISRKKICIILLALLVFNITFPIASLAAANDDYDLLEEFLDIIIGKVYDKKESDPDLYADVDTLLRNYFASDEKVEELSDRLELILDVLGDENKEEFLEYIEDEGKTIEDAQEAILLLKDWSKSDRLVILDMIKADKSKSSVRDKVEELIEKYTNDSTEVLEGSDLVEGVDPEIIEEIAKVEFSDLEEHWSKEAVGFMAGLGIIKGYEDGTFMPEKNTSRAEFTSLIVRLFDFKGTEEENKPLFSDVEDGSWYYDIIDIAVENGLISSNSGDSFKPNESITREDMAVIAIKALEKAGKLESVSELQAKDVLLKYVDQDQISDSAAINFGKAVKIGLISGRSNTELAPKGNLTRAESATILERIYQILMEK